MPPLRIVVVADGIFGETLADRLQSSPTEGVAEVSKIDPTDTPTHRHHTLEGADIVIVTVRPGLTANFVADVAVIAPHECVMVSIQRGIGNSDATSKILQELGRSDIKVIAGAAMHDGDPNHLLWERSNTHRLEMLRRECESVGIAVDTRDDMIDVLNTRLMHDLSLAVNALAGLTVHATLLSRDLRRTIALCQFEALEVFSAAGLRTARITPLLPDLDAQFLRFPTPLYRILGAWFIRAAPRQPGSMSRDLERGHLPDIDDLQGLIVRLGNEYDIPTPVCECVVELVYEAQRAGRNRFRWSGPDLLFEVLERREHLPRHQKKNPQRKAR